MASNRIRFIIERQYKELIFWFLNIVSVLLVFKTSDDPIIPILKGGFFEKLFQQFYYSNTLVNDIAIGYLVSVIFYIVVVYLPERQKQKDVEPLINSKCESIIFSSYALIQDIIQKSGFKYDYRELTKEQMLEMCKSVNPKDTAGLFHNGFNSYSQHHFGYSIYNHWGRIAKEVDEIYKFLPFIETGLIKRLNMINEHFIKYMVQNLATVEKLKNTDLEAWSDTFFSYYLVAKNFRDYYVQYSKSKFDNDPWKKFTAPNTTQTTSA